MNERDLFIEALQIDDAGGRAIYLDRACAADSALRKRVEVLLAAFAQAGSFLQQPAGDPRETSDISHPRALGGSEPAEKSGMAIGPYKLIEEIGEGGMGTVWMAQQTEPVKRLVALKLIKAGMDSKQVIARFEAERQALALMDHPNIARVLDAGATESGRPYFVMELVKGRPITSYCDAHRLTPRQRLELFVPVCLAVHHAHQKGIIHRDLKPSNVLVALYDGRPIPKVIDFGIAKATGPQLTNKTLVTGFGAIVGTLEYMSPEQAEVNQLDIDTRSDIYSLGVLLYELLAGTPPFSREDLEKAGMLEMLRVIREKEPSKPSLKLSTAVGLPTLAANRGTEPAKLTRLVRGELDWIVMKALEKDRSRRYENANGFAMDVSRFLADEPVQACPPSAGYRMRKFVKRNRGRVLAGTALVVSLLAGAVAVLAVEARAARDRAATIADQAIREAGTTASVAEAVRDARARMAEAWNGFDYPDRMTQATSAALAAIRRADGFIASGSPTNSALVELAAARHDVDELARHSKLVTDCLSNQRKFAEDLNSRQGLYPIRLRLAQRHRKALLEFGLDVVGNNLDTVARAITASRLRDAILGMIQEWHVHEISLHTMWPQVQDIIRQREAAGLPASEFVDVKSMPSPDPAIKERLDQVLRASRRLCGGAYARWQDLLDQKDGQALAAFAATPEVLQFRSTLLHALARDLLDFRQEQAGADLLRAATERYPHDLWLQVELATSCLRSENWPEALRYYSAANALSPDTSSFIESMAQCYNKLGAYDLAEKELRKALLHKDQNPGLIVAVGILLRNRKDYDGAIDALRQGMKLSPGNQPLADLLNQWLTEKKDWDGLTDDPKGDLQRMQGRWERTTPEGKPLPNGERIVKEVSGNKETVTWYNSKGEVTRSHGGTVVLGKTCKVRTWTYSDMVMLHGPAKGQKLNITGTYVYVVKKDTFFEIPNLLTSDDDGQPTFAVWKRVREK